MSKSEKPANYYDRHMLNPVSAEVFQLDSDGTNWVIEIERLLQFKIRLTYDEAAELAERLSKLSKKTSRSLRKGPSHPAPYHVRIGNILLMFDQLEAKSTVKVINEAFEKIKSWEY